MKSVEHSEVVTKSQSHITLQDRNISHFIINIDWSLGARIRGFAEKGLRGEGYDLGWGPCQSPNSGYLSTVHVNGAPWSCAQIVHLYMTTLPIPSGFSLRKQNHFLIM